MTRSDPVGMAAVAGAVVPLLNIRATAGLIDALTARTVTDASPEQPLLALLAPYAPWLLLLVGTMIAHHILFMTSFQHYLAAHLNERVRERFDRQFYGKALSLRLEAFERPEVYDRMTRAYRTMSSMAGQPLYQAQRLISCTAGALSILWALAEVHWVFPSGLLLGGLYMMRWSFAEERTFIRITTTQTPLQRRQAYWRSLLTERAPGAEVRLFDLGDYILTAWRRLTGQMIDESSAAQWRFAAQTSAAVAVLVVLHGGSVAGLIYLAGEGALTVGKLIAFLYAIYHYLFFLHNNAFRIARIQRLGKTVLLISHRLGSARLADRILFLEGGRIVEEGSHVDLIRQGGRYARMYAVQAGWYT